MYIFSFSFFFFFSNKITWQMWFLATLTTGCPFLKANIETSTFLFAFYLESEQVVHTRSSWAKLKCGQSSLTPTCCRPTLLSYGGPPHFVVLSAGTCIPCIAVSESSKSSSLYLCLSVSVSLAPFRPPLPCCLEIKKESKLGRWREKEKEGPTKGGWKRRWDQREGRASRGDEVWDALNF